MPDQSGRETTDECPCLDDPGARCTCFQAGREATHEEPHFVGGTCDCTCTACTYSDETDDRCLCPGCDGRCDMEHVATIYEESVGS